MGSAFFILQQNEFILSILLYGMAILIILALFDLTVVYF